eukprot:GFUD01113788.1.p1 GENE.GFUD01113788.1~~GFUD01113788.1.p1  ORF type:complete len:249 (-),score=80.88 GFUD01113788.1:46-792(-)
MADTTVGLLTLPSEVFAKICSFLPPYSVCQLEVSSSQARQAVELGSVWRGHVKQLARETSSVFLCSMLAIAKERECSIPAVFKRVLGVRLKIDTMVEEIRAIVEENRNTMVEEIISWCFDCSMFEELVFSATPLYNKKWKVDVLPIVSEHGEETDMMATIFEEGMKDIERKLNFVKELRSDEEFCEKCKNMIRLFSISLEFLVRLEGNELIAHLNKICDIDEAMSTEESDTEAEDGQVEETDTEDNEN